MGEVGFSGLSVLTAPGQVMTPRPVPNDHVPLPAPTPWAAIEACRGASLNTRYL